MQGIQKILQDGLTYCLFCFFQVFVDNDKNVEYLASFIFYTQAA